MVPPTDSEKWTVDKFSRTEKTIAMFPRP